MAKRLALPLFVWVALLLAMPHVYASLPQQRYLSSEVLEETTGSIGFTVGALAGYQFQLVKYADAPDLSENFVDWSYDAYGRKVAETVYDSTNAVTSQTLYVWDGWRLVSELDGLNGDRVAAEYVPGPGYVDDVVAGRALAQTGLIFGNHVHARGPAGV